ncbi:MAG: hypothetical protein ACYTGN_13790 [Planctomycetota bacterium]
MRYLKFLAIAVLVAGAYAYGQGKAAPAGKYRAVVTIQLLEGRGKTKDRFKELPHLTDALNNLAAQGYEPYMINPFDDGGARRVIVVGRR